MLRFVKSFLSNYIIELVNTDTNIISWDKLIHIHVHTHCIEVCGYRSSVFHYDIMISTTILLAKRSICRERETETETKVETASRCKEPIKGKG